ncbi:putative secreted protein [Rhodovulum euryhalinum]|uniref:Putative secreted protein n=2 Tax=Rhodovulum euryhalinum TaxID=35805 RepID=A0A4R2KCJ2_9RHOB|nr:putative secreted protein [Rhodovulum euryhalinum]
MKFSEIAGCSAATILLGLALSPVGAHATTLSNLIAGSTLIQGDVTFDNFAFTDFFDSETPFAGDRPVSASQIEITTAATASTVSLTATIAPGISIAGAPPGTNLDHIFEFFLDFTVSVAAPSTRQIIGASLGGGDLSASGDAVSEVVFAPGGFSIPGDRLEIFEAPGFVPSSASSDSQSLTAASSYLFEGSIEGNTGVGGMAGLSTFTLTFDLAGNAPPGPAPVPIPASLPLLLGALAGLGLLHRRPRG